MTAPSRPAAARAAMSLPAVPAAAHAADAATNPAIPVSSIRRRPKMSPSRPPVNSPTAMARA